MKILNVTFAESEQDKRAWSGTASRTLQKKWVIQSYD